MPADTQGVYTAFRTVVSRLRERKAGSGHTAPGQTPEATRVQAALEMHELGVRMYRQRMHREHPQATRREIGGTITHQHAVGRDHRRWYLREVPDLFTGALRGREG